MRDRRVLYVITDGGELRRQGVLLEKLEELFQGVGDRICALQWREHVSQGAAEAAALCRKYGIPFLINRDPLLVQQLDAQLHAGMDTAEPLGSVSVHSFEEAKEALKQKIPFVLLAPIFKPRSKPAARPALGVEILQMASEEFRQAPSRLIALGGIAVENIESVSKSGAGGFASIGELLQAPNSLEAARNLIRYWDQSA